MNTENPKISVIVPVYRVEKYLKECVDSILAQTYTNIEVILVDDGSPDSCPQICDDYAKQDARVVVVHQKNGGMSVARNKGIEKATGEYFAFVDSDDYIQSNMLEFLYKNAKNYDADIAECNFYFCYTNKIISKEKIERKVYTAEEALADLFLGENLNAVVWNKLYKREIFSQITFPVGRWYEDTATVYKLFYQCKKLVYCPIPKYYYRKRSDSITTTKFNIKSLDMLTAGREIVEFVKKNCPNLFDEAMLFYTYSYVMVYQRMLINEGMSREEKILVRTFEKELKEISACHLKNPLLKKKTIVFLKLHRFSSRFAHIVFSIYFRWKDRGNHIEE